MAVLDAGTYLATVRTVLSGLSAWQTLCGVSTAAEAIQHIHFGALDLDKDASPGDENPCMILDVTSLPTEWRGNRLHGTITVEIRVYLSMPESERATYGSQYVWVWSKFSAILDAINGVVGDAGEIMIRSMAVPLFPGRVDPDNNGGEGEWLFVLSLTSDII
jgi:hypothetical protein